MIRLLIALFFGYIVFRCTTVMNEVDEIRATRKGVAESPGSEPTNQRPARAPVWQRKSYADALTGKEAVLVEIESTNREVFDWPNDGGVVARFVVRRHPQYGVDAYITIDKGQLTCAYSDCRVAWRVDDKPIRNIEVSKPEDGSSNTYFLTNPSKLIKELQGAKRLIVQTSVFQEGTRAWDFSVAGFEAP